MRRKNNEPKWKLDGEIQPPDEKKGIGIRVMSKEMSDSDNIEKRLENISTSPTFYELAATFIQNQFIIRDNKIAELEAEFIWLFDNCNIEYRTYSKRSGAKFFVVCREELQQIMREAGACSDGREEAGDE